MGLFKSIIVAFSMYSNLPMPKIEWTKQSMKYAICFFPLIGIVIGAMLVAWADLANMLSFNNLIFAGIAAYIPILVTGGIHMDGFCDTIDARASNQSVEKRLLILKDSNAGAFAVIKCGIYYILYFAAFTQVNYQGTTVVALGFVLSRALSGIALINFKSAKKDGLAVLFKDYAHKRIVTIVLLVIAVYIAFGMIVLDTVLGAAALIISGCVFLYYRYFSYKEFGGVTGDLAGYFLQICEIYILYAIIIMQGAIKLWF